MMIPERMIPKEPRASPRRWRKVAGEGGREGGRKGGREK